MEVHPRLAELGFTLRDGCLEATGVSITSARFVGARALIAISPGDVIPVGGVARIHLRAVTMGGITVGDFVCEPGKPVPPSVPVPIATPRAPVAPFFSRRPPAAPHPPAQPSPAAGAYRAPAVAPIALDGRLVKLGFSLDDSVPGDVVLRVDALENVRVNVRAGGVEIVLPGGETSFVPDVRFEAGTITVSGPGSVGIDLS